MKILLTDCGTLNYRGDIPLDIFNKYGEVLCYDNIQRDKLLEIVGDVDIILCNKTLIDSCVMKKAHSLKYIGIFATGYNNIDIATAKKLGITVCNAGSYSTSAVAQQVFAYILSHYNAVEKYNSYVKNGGWIDTPTFAVLCFATDELKDKTLGIIGYGSIGKRVAEIALAFEMKVLVYTRTPKTDNMVSFVSLDELLSLSDIVTAHCPLNDESRELFNDPTFAKMKDGCYFINTARGGIVNEQALLNALESGKLSGAAIDVLDKEPMSKDCALINAPNLIITPHTAWAPLTTRLRLLDVVVANLDAFLSGNPQNVVL